MDLKGAGIIRTDPELKLQENKRVFVDVDFESYVESNEHQNQQRKREAEETEPCQLACHPHPQCEGEGKRFTRI